MKARKKPVEVEFCRAADLNGDLTVEIPQWLVKALSTPKGILGAVWIVGDEICVRSKEGVVKSPINSCMIMRGVQGELYLCDKDIFHATYEVLL